MTLKRWYAAIATTSQRTQCPHSSTMAEMTPHIAPALSRGLIILMNLCLKPTIAGLAQKVRTKRLYLSKRLYIPALKDGVIRSTNTWGFCAFSLPTHG